MASRNAYLLRVCSRPRLAACAQAIGVFYEMMNQKCERSVITFSSLISACEKAGNWQMAVRFFEQMHEERCLPNTVTFNSLITACAQGVPWSTAHQHLKIASGELH